MYVFSTEVVLAKLLCTGLNNFGTEVDWYRTGPDSALIGVSTWILYHENARRSFDYMVLLLRWYLAPTGQFKTYNNNNTKPANPNGNRNQ